MGTTVDICTTATLRPDLYEESLRSFRKYVTGDFRLILNIDPVGPGSADEVEAVARSYFDNILVYRPQEPNFQLAQLRLWGSVESEFFLNLEDDWKFLVPVDVPEILRTLEQEPDLALLRFSKWESNEFARQWNKRGIPWNGRYFELTEDLRARIGFSGHPSIIRTKFLKPLLCEVNPGCDIEKQLKAGSRFTRYLNSWRYGIWQKQHTPATIRDIGTGWRREHRWKKNGETKHMWSTWEKMQ